MSTPTLATLALTTRIVPSEAKPLSAKEFWPLNRRVPLADLTGMNAADIAREASISVAESERLLRLLDRSTAVALAVERLEQAGVWTIMPNDEYFPRRFVHRLRDAAPPVLHGVGRRAALCAEMIGIVGSRDVNLDAAHVARRAAPLAVEAGFTVASGAARGVDQHAMSASFDAGGTSVGVLADALLRVVKQRQVPLYSTGGCA